jgi:hypothetical protein
MRESKAIGKTDQSEILALLALGWLLEDERRARRLLDMTGLDPGGLRAGANDPAVLAAVMAFLAGHEPDLLACAQALGVAPEALAAAQGRLAP